MSENNGDLPAFLRQPIKWTGNSSDEPTRQYSGDAGFDLFCAQGVLVEPAEFKDIDCGIKVELPEGVWALATGRSSTLRKRQLLIAQGVIDNGYRGPIFVGAWNLGKEPCYVARGERVAQLIPFPLIASVLRLERVDELSTTDRGEAAFGSTGS